MKKYNISAITKDNIDIQRVRQRERDLGKDVHGKQTLPQKKE